MACGKLRDMHSMHIATLLVLDLVIVLCFLSLLFPYVHWSSLAVDTSDGTYCFEQSIGLIASEQCACEKDVTKCWEVDIDGLPAEYDFLKIGGKTMYTLVLVALLGALGCCGVVFMRGGNTARNQRGPNYKNLQLFASVCCLYTCVLFAVAAILWAEFINRKLNENFSEKVAGDYNLDAGFYLTVVNSAMMGVASGMQIWAPEPVESAKSTYK